MTTTRTYSLRLRILASLALGIWAIGLNVTALADDAEQWDKKKMELTSTTFTDGSVLPISMIFESPNPQGTNACSIDGSPGSNTSPELSWANAPRGTQTFAVVLYDTTAAFTHGGYTTFLVSVGNCRQMQVWPRARLESRSKTTFFWAPTGTTGHVRPPKSHLCTITCLPSMRST